MLPIVLDSSSQDNFQAVDFNIYLLSLVPLGMHPLFEVKNTASSAAAKLTKLNSADFVDEMKNRIQAEADFFDESLSLDFINEIIEMIFKKQVDQIFFKQFPDGKGKKAVYQAVTCSPAEVQAVHDIHFYDNSYEFTLHDVASFPLKETLGIDLSAQKPLLGFYVNMDFQADPAQELSVKQGKKEKIAILGGGVAAMTTAFYLTEQDNWQDKYDITVYQLGWRLGGKGASGRNAEYGQRIEEHGLHIWFGFYDNAFKTIQRAYELLDRPEGAPLRTWRDAFKPHSYIVLQEFINKEWKTWPLDFPMNDRVPGQGSEALNLEKLAQDFYFWVKKFIKDLMNPNTKTEQDIQQKNEKFDELWTTWHAQIAEHLSDADMDMLNSSEHHGSEKLEHLLHLVEDGLGDIVKAGEKKLANILRMIRGVLHLWGDFVDLDNDDSFRHYYMAADLALTILIGMLEEHVFRSDITVLNKYDYREFLRKYGADTKYTIQSTLVTGFYDLAFAYEDGEFSKANIEAGTIILSMLRIVLDYNGAVMWKMQAGMGDTIFTPYYEALKKRGVKFEFFNQVDELVPNQEHTQISEIKITEQVALKDSVQTYDPFVMVKDLACWPSTPNYDQLDPAQVALLKKHNIDLESFWTEWPTVYENAFGEKLPQRSLKQGEDFDQVVFGISIGSFPYLCPQLVAHDTKLKNMVDNIKVVATQAYQTWNNAELKDMGWSYFSPTGEEPVLTSFTEPFDTWAAMNQLLKREEAWQPGDLEAKNVAYFCNAMPVPALPAGDTSFPEKYREQAKQNAIHHLTHDIYHLWPDAASAGEYHWDNLIDPSNACGVARFDSQYWRANISPSERYVLSVKGSSQYRLETDETPYKNLYLTGDWIKTELNVGCVEAATMAGIQTSRAISGYSK